MAYRKKEKSEVWHWCSNCSNFPKKGYELVGYLSDQVRLISDAVPPPMATALGASIIDFMENCGT